ncbi:MAG: TIGR03118 family protein, partial [Polyangiaceae bacterium]
DANLVNAWGLAFAPSGHAWVNANGTGLSQVYGAQGELQLSVSIPAPPSSCTSSAPAVSAPTGNVFNPDADTFNGDTFIFVTEDGTIAGWQSSFGATARLRVDNSQSTALYKGVTLSRTVETKMHADSRHDGGARDRGTRLYAANFHAGSIDVFNRRYEAVQAEGGFVDSSLPMGYAPFNVQAIDAGIIVTYALQGADKKDDVKGLGNGFVDLFDRRGFLIQRLISNGALDSPWGIAFAPSDFGGLGGRLLVGNFGNGMINAYSVDFSQGSQIPVEFVGALGTSSGTPLVIDGLWALRFGPGAAGFGTNQLFYTAGPNDEAHGLFGRIDAQQ